MVIESAATFLINSVLIGLGLTILAIIILLLNNLFSKFWKPVKFSVYQYHPFSHNEPLMGPEINTSNTQVANSTIEVKK